MADTKLAVNVFDGETAPEQETSTTPGNTPSSNDSKTSPEREGETTNTVQAVDTKKEDSQDIVATFTPWIAAGIVAAIILIALLAILRKLNKKA